MSNGFDAEKEFNEAQALGHPHDAAYFGDPYHMPRVAKIREVCEGSVLDLGAGDGWIAKALQSDGHEVVGIEITDTRRARALERHNVKLLPGNVNEPLPFKDGSFDTVLAGDIIEHLHDPSNCLGEMVRIARKRLVISIPRHPLHDEPVAHVWGIRTYDIGDMLLVMTLDKINRDR